VNLKQYWGGTANRLAGVNTLEDTLERIKRTLKEVRKFSTVSRFKLKLVL
jgi:hypothetical protein